MTKPDGVAEAVDSGLTLTGAAFEALRADIIAGRREPGERLRIERLRQIYNIGPTPLREALQRLCAEGLVVSEGNRGFTVSGLDPQELADLNLARIELEKAALRLSLIRGDEDWEAGVAAAAWRMRRSDLGFMSGTVDMDGWERANAAFHASLVAACGSKWLLRMRNTLNDQYARFRRASVGHAWHRRDLVTEHATIADAVLARDVDKACYLVEQHFRATEQQLGAAGRP